MDAQCNTADQKLELSWPVLDDAALHGLAGDVARALDPHTEADPVGILIQFLTAFGNIIGNNPYYQVESDKHHTNLFSCSRRCQREGAKGNRGWAREGCHKAC